MFLWVLSRSWPFVTFLVMKSRTNSSLKILIVWIWCVCHRNLLICGSGGKSRNMNLAFLEPGKQWNAFEWIVLFWPFRSWDREAQQSWGCCIYGHSSGFLIVFFCSTQRWLGASGCPVDIGQAAGISAWPASAAILTLIADQGMVGICPCWLQCRLASAVWKLRTKGKTTWEVE